MHRLHWKGVSKLSPAQAKRCGVDPWAAPTGNPPHLPVVHGKRTQPRVWCNIHRTKHSHKPSIRSGVLQSWRKTPRSDPSARAHISRNDHTKSRKPSWNLACQGLCKEKLRVSPMSKGSCSDSGQQRLAPGGSSNTASHTFERRFLHA
jgi:hypothetical protein